MVERTVDWEIISIAFVVTLIILGGIYFLGQGLNQYKIDSIRSDIRQVEVQQQSQALGFELARNFEGDSCEAMKTWVKTSTPKISELRKNVAAYESSSKFSSDNYVLLKKRYTNLIIQNMLEVRTLESKCNIDVLDITYFYSKDNCARCEDQGTVLTYYRRKYSSRLIVYPLDTDLNMRNIDFLENVYNVTDYPALVVDGKVYRGFQSKEELGKIIEKNMEEANRTKALVVNK